MGDVSPLYPYPWRKPTLEEVRATPGYILSHPISSWSWKMQPYSPLLWFPTEPPEVTMELSQLVIPWGQSAKLTCEVRGNPPPSVLWLRNAVPLAASQRLRLSRRALRVVSVGPEDEGVYQCMAENEVGSAHAVVQLRTARPGKYSPGDRDSS
jgi:hypothetical protein